MLASPSRLRGSFVPYTVSVSFVLLLHLAATLCFLPPGELLNSTPLLSGDYPVHTHRVHVYRAALAESGLPWGYDPGLSAGTVMNPGQDLGAKPLQIFGILVPFLDAGAAVKLFVFLAVLAFPLCVLIGCRMVGIPEDYHPWILLSLVVPMWADYRIVGFLRWGLVTFVTASHVAVMVLALFLKYLNRPTTRTYLLLSAAAALLFLLHVLGPVVLIPALVGFTALMSGVEPRHRLLLAAIPLLVVLANAFWAYPLLLAQDIPQPAGFSPRYPPDAIGHLQFGDGSILNAPFSSVTSAGAILLSAAAALYGLIVLRKEPGPRVSTAIGITCAFGLLITLFGSDLPGTSAMQPVRFIVPTFVFMTIPVGVALGSLSGLAGVDLRASAAAVALCAAPIGFFNSIPAPLEDSQATQALGEYVIAHTTAEQRLLIQSHDGYNHDGYEAKVFPMWLDREVISSNFPQIYDPPQFLKTMLLGKEILEWEPRDLRPALERWGADRIFTVTPEATALLRETVGTPIDSAAGYEIFRAPSSPSRFVHGSGRVEAGINRIVLTDLRPHQGVVVLRYRFHPAWESESETALFQYPVSEDPAGFLALRNPPDSVVLRFRPWTLLRAPWPARRGGNEAIVLHHPLEH